MKKIIAICTAYLAFNLVVFICCYLMFSHKLSAISDHFKTKEVEYHLSFGLQRLQEIYTKRTKTYLQNHRMPLDRLRGGLDGATVKRMLARLHEEDQTIQAIKYVSGSGEVHLFTVFDHGKGHESHATALGGAMALDDKDISLQLISNSPLLSFQIPLLDTSPSVGRLEVIASAWATLFNFIKQATGLETTLAFSRDWFEVARGGDYPPVFVPCGDFLLYRLEYNLTADQFCTNSQGQALSGDAIFIPLATDGEGKVLAGIEAIGGNGDEDNPFRSILLWAAIGTIASSFLALVALLTVIGTQFSRAERQSRIQRSTIEVLADSVKKNKRSLLETTARLKQEIREKRLIKAALSRHEDVLESIFNGIQDGLLALDTEFTIVSANESILTLFDVEPPIVGKKCYQYFHGRTEPCDPCPTKQAIERKCLQRVDLEIQQDGNQSKWLMVYAYPIFDKEKNVTGVVEFIRDVTEKKRLEKERETLKKQLIQSQKLEAIGTLAGGIAHDFNNILMAISGYIELAYRKGGPFNADMRRYFNLINQSVERASGLIKQLLIFSREEPMSTSDISLPGLLEELMGMIDQLLGKKIEIELHFSDSPQIIKGNKGRLEQVFMNLAINARDAMPQGGKITISTTTMEVTEEQCLHIPHARPGKYVRIDFVDTGVGMNSDVVERIFEPFFTTKEIGKGTGLGLAIVYSIIKDHNGWIDVESEVGIGTKFSIFIPVHS